MSRPRRQLTPNEVWQRRPLSNGVTYFVADLEVGDLRITASVAPDFEPGRYLWGVRIPAYNPIKRELLPHPEQRFGGTAASEVEGKARCEEVMVANGVEMWGR